MRPEFEENEGVVGYSAEAVKAFDFGSDGDGDGDRGGDDEIHGDDGDDILYGQGGDDAIFGEDGNDHLVGGTGKDDMDGGAGKDKEKGGSDGDPDVTRNVSNAWMGAFTNDLAGFRSQVLPDQTLWIDSGNGGSDGGSD